MLCATNARPNQWNMVDLQKLTDLDSHLPSLEALFGRLQVPLGLLPAANEYLAQERLPPVTMRYPRLITDDSIPDCRALTRIRQGMPLLVKTTNQFNDPTLLIQRICAHYPKARISILVKNQTEGCRLTTSLRANGQDCFYFENSNIIREYSESKPVPRIRIAPTHKLAILELELHGVDILIITEPVQFVKQDYFGSVDDLFNSGSGTCISPHCRLVGITPESTQAHDLYSLFPYFGMDYLLLGPDGKAFPPPTVIWLSRTKNDRTIDRVGLSPTLSKLKKELIWQNTKRNRFVLDQVIALQRQISQRNVIGQGIGVVVENDLHKQAIQCLWESQGHHSTLLNVFSFEEIEHHLDLPTWLFRADAGVGNIPMPAPTKKHFIVDVKDQSPPFLNQQRSKRLKVYQGSCLIGSSPFGSMLNNVLPK